MKLPRHVGGDELAHLLHRYGYCVVHQTGSHQHLPVVIAGKTHDLTIPNRKPLRVGTLHRILKDVAEHQEISHEQILEDLSG